MRLARLLLVLLGVVVLIPAAASAQSQLGGNVTDDTGGALPGVTVTAASEALIEGQVIGITDGTGQYTIINLRPGSYTVTYDLPGFGTQVRNDVTLASDVTLNLDVVLGVGTVEETITVSGESPVVDIQQTDRTEVLTRETLEAIPTGNSLYSFGTLVPGIRTSLPDIGGARAMEQVLMYGNGAGGMDTTVLVDGMQVNAAIGNGAYQMYFNPQMNAETSFTTSGAGADTQRGGVRVNMVPKDGGNTFSGTGYFGGSHRSWQSSVWNERFGEMGVQSKEQGDARDGVPRIDRVYDLNSSLGGPIVRDKLWFFGSLRDWSTDLVVLNSFYRDGSPGVDDNRLTSGLMRLTYQANTRNKFSAYLDRIRKVRFHEHGEGDDIEDASQKRRPILYYTAGAKWTGTLSNRVLAEFGFSANGEVYPIGYQPQVEQAYPSAGVETCLNTPCFPTVGSAQHLIQTATGDPWYGGPSGVWTSKQDDRLGFDEYGSNRGSTVNYPFKQNLIGSVSYVTGSHNVKVGFENSWSRETKTRFSNAHLYQTYGDDPNPFGVVVPWITADSNRAEVNNLAGLAPGLIGAPEAVQVFNDPTFSRTDVPYDYGIYAQDSWTIDRLTINYGIRMDAADIGIPHSVKPAGRFTTLTDFTLIPEADFPRFGPDWSPRFSLAYDAFGNGKTALKFGFNRYQNAFGDSWADRYQPSLNDQEGRSWNDITRGADGSLPAGCDRLAPLTGCPDPYGTNGDNIAQDWEIGLLGRAGFGVRETDRPSLDLSRGYQDLLTVGIQQEVRPGLSVTAEYRRRWFKNPENRDNVLRSFSDFGDPIQMVAPLPYVGNIPIYNIDPAVRTLYDEVDQNFGGGGGFKNQYQGFELSFQGRLTGGGTVFGGWSMDTPGTSWFSGGGLVNACPLVRESGDNPNSLRFCNAFDYPTPYRHEFKVSGNYPLPWYDLQMAGTIIANAGGWAGYALSETRSVTRTSNTYLSPWWNATNCTAANNCVVGAGIIATANGGTAPPTVGTSTYSTSVTMLPGNSVKFPPYWIQMDTSIGKVFDLGGRVRWEVRMEGFNLTNAGFERSHRSSRGTVAGRQSGIFEYASTINNGRIMRLSTTARW